MESRVRPRWDVTLNRDALELIGRYRDVALGWKISGAGGGGYLILASSRPIENGLRISARSADA